MNYKHNRPDFPPGWEVPPWEIPGNIRLDCQPHSGALLRRLANGALMGVLLSLPVALNLAARRLTTEQSLFHLLFTLIFLVPTGILSLTVWLLAHRQISHMRAGLVDQSGEWEVRFAQDRARTSFFLCLLILLVGAFVFLSR